MRHLILAATLVVASTFALAPANAQDRMGPLVVNGQCKHFGNNSNSLYFYYWGDCPTTEIRRGGVGVRTVRVTAAAASVAHHRLRKHNG